MSNDPLQAAQAKIAQHRAEIARLEQFVEMYVALSGGKPLPTPEPTPLPPALPVLSFGPASADPKPQKIADASTTAEIIEAATQVLRERGVALPALDIYEKLMERGIRINGNKPRANMTAKFATRKDLLHYTEATGKWSLVEWDKKARWFGAGAAQSEEAV